MELKTCKVCNTEKNLTDFYRNRRKPDGHDYICKVCDNARGSLYYQKNKEKVDQKNKRWFSANPEKAYSYTKTWKEKNKARWAKHMQEWQKANPGKIRAVSAKRRAQKLLATPGWLTPEHIQLTEVIYDNCPKGYHVDHIIPLQGKNVCGLHVPWNLQYLPAAENIRKGNRI